MCLFIHAFPLFGCSFHFILYARHRSISIVHGLTVAVACAHQKRPVNFSSVLFVLVFYRLTFALRSNPLFTYRRLWACDVQTTECVFKCVKKLRVPTIHKHIEKAEEILSAFSVSFVLFRSIDDWKYFPIHSAMPL